MSSGSTQSGKVEIAILQTYDSITVARRHQQLQQFRFGQTKLGASYIPGESGERLSTEPPLQIIQALFSIIDQSPGGQLMIATAGSELVLLGGCELQLLHRHRAGAHEEHILRQNHRHPRQSVDDVALQRIDFVYVVDEYHENLVIHILAPFQQALKPIVDVERIETGVFRQVPFGNLQYNGYLLTDDPQKLQIVSGARRGG